MNVAFNTSSKTGKKAGTQESYITANKNETAVFVASLDFNHSEEAKLPQADTIFAGDVLYSGAACNHQDLPDPQKDAQKDPRKSLVEETFSSPSLFDDDGSWAFYENNTNVAQTLACCLRTRIPPLRL
jgi:hypothetical protein